MNLRFALSGIRKTYGTATVLEDCTWIFDKPGVYVLTGANGAGKSTLFRISSLLETPDSGEIIFSENGRELAKDLALKRRMTLVLPKVGVFGTSVFNNAAYGLNVRSMRREEIEERVMESLEHVGLADKRLQDARTLSSGETQRLGIARALVIRPDILFLDEPTASVDERNSRLIEEIIAELKQKSDSVVVMTTHDREQAELLADTLLVLKDGKLSLA